MWKYDGVINAWILHYILMPKTIVCSIPNAVLKFWKNPWSIFLKKIFQVLERYTTRLKRFPAWYVVFFTTAAKTFNLQLVFWNRRRHLAKQRSNSDGPGYWNWVLATTSKFLQKNEYNVSYTRLFSLTYLCHF